MASRVSLTELAAAGIRLRPTEAVAIVSEICRQYATGGLRGIPSAGVIRITRDGDVVAEGPVTTNQDPVQRAAHLLNVLVGGFDAPPEYRASGALQIVIARALGTLDLPRYDSLEDFGAALGRFATLDVGGTARDLFNDWTRTRVPREVIAAPLTISDVRRARRATGLTLQDIAAVAGVPVLKLRDLEWGDVREWRADAEGRAHLMRYARAAGLDDQVVLSIAWPMIEEAAAIAPVAAVPVTALVPSGSQELVPITRPLAAGAGARGPSRWRGAAVVAVLLGVAVTDARPWDRPLQLLTVQAEQNGTVRVAPAPRQPRPAARTLVPTGARAPKVARARAVPSRGAVVEQAAKAPIAVPVRHGDAIVGPDKPPVYEQAGRENPTQDVPKRPARTPFLEKALLRIVIR